MKRFIAATLATAVLLPAAQVLAQPPAITHTVPGAIGVGQPADITLFGANLAGPTAIWNTIPNAKVELTPGLEGNGTKS